MQEDRDEEAAEEVAEREGDRLVGLVEAGGENAEADRHHQHPGAVPGTSRPTDQSRDDEGHADEKRQRDREARVLLVVARQREGHAYGTRGDRRRPEEEPRASRKDHAAKNAAIAAPDRSPFGTKPWAPHSPMQRP